MIQLQWVNGDANKAENSFYKINQQQTPLNDTEIALIKNRKKPHVISARAIIHAGKGHKYWKNFSDGNQSEIENLSKQIHKLLYEPKFKNPLKSINLPIAHNPISSLGLPILFDIINIANDYQNPVEDVDGTNTLIYLRKTKELIEIFNSNQPGSLGLHPIIYCYSKDGNFRNASLYGILLFVKKLKTKNKFKEFIDIRLEFEEFIYENEDILQQIVRKNRQAQKATVDIANMYEFVMNFLFLKKSKEEIAKLLVQEQAFNYLKFVTKQTHVSPNKDFNNDSKSAIFIRDSIKTNLKCPICKCLIHSNSISIDHIDRKQDGGNGNIENGQVTHPFCNTGYNN